MRIGLIDVDGHNFPNLPLMKLSEWHKAQGDHVEWYEPYYQYHIDSDQIIQGGSGYCISLKEGREVFDKSKDTPLPYEVEHTFPDYGLYGIKDSAFGFLTRGCPRGCSFCHVAVKEGRRSRKVANLDEFWNGQKHITLCDANILACMDWKELMQQLIDSRSIVDFNQGLDIRMMTEEKAEMICNVRTEKLHFAWDRWQDKDQILPRFKDFMGIIRDHRAMPKYIMVYVLCNYDTTFDQDLDRIDTLRNLGYSPYVMLYDKENIPRGHQLRKLQRWCNNKVLFGSCKEFKDLR